MVIAWPPIWWKDRNWLKKASLIAAGIAAIYYGAIQPRQDFRGIAESRSSALAAIEGTQLGWIGADGPALARRVLASLAAPICAGALVAWALDTPRGFARLRPILAARAASPAALLLLVTLVVDGRAPPIVRAVSMSLLVATCAVRGDHGLRACLEARPLLFVGTISYELYLVHVAAITAVKRVVPAHAGDAPLVFACGLALALPMAYVLHRAVGVPLEPLRARLRMPQPGRGAPAPEAASPAPP